MKDDLKAKGKRIKGEQKSRGRDSIYATGEVNQAVREHESVYLYKPSMKPERSNSSRNRVSTKSFGLAVLAADTFSASSANTVLKPSSVG